MKKYLIVSIVVLALIIVPFTAKASVIDDLMKVIINLQTQIINLLKQRGMVATSTPIGGGIACTMEAKQCPDGSYVGRQGPKCEFKACPGAESWKEYHDEILGFSLSYPAGYTVSRELRTKYSNGKNWYQIRVTDPSKKASLLIEVNPDGYGPIFADGNLTVNKNSSGYLTMVSTETLAGTANNLDGIKIISVNSVGDYDWTISYPDYVSQRDYSKSQEFDTTLKNILTSFKFPDSDDNWQTYRNEQYGFEFQYPSVWELKTSNDKLIPGGVWWTFKKNGLNTYFSIASFPINVDPFLFGKFEGFSYIGKNVKYKFYTQFIPEAEPDVIKEANELKLTIKIDVSGWQTYRNEQYGFSLVFPPTWKNVQVGGGKSANVFVFSLPFEKSSDGYDPAFVISAHTQQDWARLKNDPYFGPINYLGENSSYVFTRSDVNTNYFDFSGVPSCPSDSACATDVIKKIIPTFKIIDIVSLPMISYVSSVKSTPWISNGQITSGGRVYMLGAGLSNCTSVMNCDNVVYIGGKASSMDISQVPSDGTAMSFVAPILSPGTYDLYLTNLATGIKSNIVKVTVK